MPTEDVDPGAALAELSVDPAVVISQVFGGGGNTGAPFTHDYVELFNRSDAPVTLSGMSIQYASATGTGNFGATATQLATFPDGTTLSPGRYYLIQLAGGTNGSALPAPDLVGPVIAVSGTAGKIALATGTTSLGCNGGSTPCNAAQQARIVDLLGFGNANYFETAATPALSNTTAALRKGTGCADTNNNSADFDVVAPAPRNGTTAAAPCGPVGDQAPTVASTAPADNATNVSPNVAVQISFSEAVTTTNSWFTFQCSLSGSISATVSGGPTTFTLTPASDLSNGDDCSVVVTAGSISDVDADDPPDTMASDYSLDFSVAASLTPLSVHAIQGAAHSSPYQGQTVNVGPAIVTALRGDGFYMQEPSPDSDDATSEGILVYTAATPGVAVGSEVTVIGTVAELRPGCTPSCAPSVSAYDNLTTTEITGPSVTVIGTGRPVPAPTVLGSGPGERAVPPQIIEDDASGSVEATGSFDPASDGIDFYESLEGMRVQLNSPQVVDPTRSFSGGTSLEIGVLARADAGLRTARGGIVIAENDFNPERVFLSNSIVSSFPTLNVGDSFSGAVVGVLDYNFANYKLAVTAALPAVISGALAPETTTLAPTSASQLTMASMNVENLDALDPPAKFSELAQIVVSRLGSPDLVALEEVQDNNGPTNNGTVDASTTLSTFASAITAAGGPAYAFRQINPVNNQDGGEPGGNIRVVFMFRTDRGLAFVDRGSATSTTANSVDTSGGAPHLAFSPGRVDPSNSAFASSRKPLAGEVTFGGKTFFVVANHFNSKGGDDPLFGRFQPPVLGSEAQRIAQATVLASFVDTLLDADPSAFVVVLGDLNDFSFSPPLDVLHGVGLLALSLTLPANERYTYVYQGNSQDLDHVMVSPSLAARATYDIVHVNAEFAAQASDHDPSIVRVQLGDPPVFSMGNDPPGVAVGGSFMFQVNVSATPAPTFTLLSGPAGMTIDSGTGVVSWNANVDAGDYAFTVQASNGVATASKQFTVSVTGPAPVPSLPAWATFLLAGLLAFALMSTKRSLAARFPRIVN